MVNHRDPARVALDFVAVSKLWHTVAGLYIWEFVTTLDYEWSVFRGHRPYMRTIWLYSLTRVGMLLAIIISLIVFDSTGPKNCQAWVTSELIVGYLALACGTLLIVIRTIAIWKKNMIVIMIAMGTWLTQASFLIYSIVQCRAYWVPAHGTCVIANTAAAGKYNAVMMLSTNLILLLIMLLGLFRRRSHGGMSGLMKLLWKQGIIWLLLATVAGVPPTVLALLNLSDPLNLLFRLPAGVTVTIAATRMYRSLTNFTSPNVSHDGPPSRIVSKANGSTTVPIPLNRMGVSVHTHSEQYGDSGLRTSQYGLCLDKDRQLYEKPNGLGIDGDVESGADAIKMSAAA